MFSFRTLFGTMASSSTHAAPIVDDMVDLDLLDLCLAAPNTADVTSAAKVKVEETDPFSTPKKRQPSARGGSPPPKASRIGVKAEAVDEDAGGSPTAGGTPVGSARKPKGPKRCIGCNRSKDDDPCWFNPEAAVPWNQPSGRGNLVP